MTATTSIGQDLKAEAQTLAGESGSIPQQYIEWQVELNSFTRVMWTGVGAGNLNSHKNRFYGQLPKVRNLSPFEYNGWLVTANELGLAGIICFMWILVHYVSLMRTAITDVRQRNGNIGTFVAVVAGIVGLGVAHAFSNINCNGNILLVPMVCSIAASIAPKRDIHV